MKKLGFAFIAVSILFVLLSTIYPYSKGFYIVNGVAFLIFLSGIWAINLHYAPEEKGMPKYDGPPLPPPLINAESMRLTIENSKKANIALAKMQTKLKFQNWIKENYGIKTLEQVVNTDIEKFAIDFFDSNEDFDFPNFPQCEPSPPKDRQY